MVLGLRAKVGEGQVGEFRGALGLFVAQGHARAVHAGWLAGWAGTGYWVWLLVACPSACSGMPLLYDDTVTIRYGDHAKSVGKGTPGRICARIIRLVPLSPMSRWEGDATVRLGIGYGDNQDSESGYPHIPIPGRCNAAVVTARQGKARESDEHGAAPPLALQGTVNGNREGGTPV